MAQPDSYSATTCTEHALFLHNISHYFSFVLPLFLAIASAHITQWIRAITPGVGDNPETPEADDTSTATAPSTADEIISIPNPTVEKDVEAWGAPSPYTPPGTSSSPATNSTAPTDPAAFFTKRSPASSFVFGTVLLLALVFTLFLLALFLQWQSYCVFAPPSTFGLVLSWLFFCLPTAFTTCGLSCYGMLVRDLWGKKAKQRWDWDELVLFEKPFIVIFCVLAFPPVFIVMLAVELVERAQGACCEEEEVVEIGELRTAEEVLSTIEGEVIPRESVEGSEDGSEGDQHGENVGLIR